MKCLLKYQWVKLSRAYLPQGKGLMGYWAKLASRAAFRKGHALYCGYKNEVIPGMWSGGIVGLKSILGLKSRAQALEIMNELSALGYISYSLDPKTKKLTYQINDWVVKCSGAECSEGTVYASDGYGFICLPRDITQRLADSNRKFSESDAWLDLWCHTVWQDSGNIFSLLAPTVQFERRKALLTLETMGQRWKWEKTKVWRFFQKYKDVFALYRLPGSYGCLIFNQLYQTGTEVSLPTLTGESISSVASRTPNVSGSIAGEIADRSLGNYMPQLGNHKLSGTQITGGHISTTATGADGKSSNVELYNASQFEKPQGPHSVVTASDGTQWYQMASGEGRNAFYSTPEFTGNAAEAAQVASVFPGAAEGTSLRTVGEGVLEASSDTGNTTWYWCFPQYKGIFSEGFVVLRSHIAICLFRTVKEF